MLREKTNLVSEAKTLIDELSDSESVLHRPTKKVKALSAAQKEQLDEDPDATCSTLNKFVDKVKAFHESLGKIPLKEVSSKVAAFRQIEEEVKGKLEPAEQMIGDGLCRQGGEGRQEEGCHGQAVPD